MTPARLLYSKADAAKLLSVSLRTVDNLIFENKLPPVRIGKRVLFRHSDLEHYVRKLAA